MSAEAAAATAPAATKEESFADVTLTKYKAAGEITAAAIKKVIAEAKAGSTVISLMETGDKAVEEGAKGVYKSDKKMPKGSAFPTTISINNVICNFSPLPSDSTASTEVKEGDVVKVQLGAHIDGFATIAAETFVIGATKEKPVEGVKANALAAAWTAAEVAIRSMKVGALNTEVAKKVEDTIKEFGCRAVDGMQTNLFDKDVIDGKKKIVLAADPTQRPDACKLEENEVYGVDIVVTTSADGKPKTDEAKTTIYKKTGSTYLLKMATSRKVFSEVQKSAGAFPFNLRILEDEKRARMGVQECVNHSLLTPFECLLDRDESAITAQVFFTVAVNNKGAIRLTPAPSWYAAEKIKADKEAGDETKKLLATAVRQTKAKKNKAAAAAKAE